MAGCGAPHPPARRALAQVMRTVSVKLAVLPAASVPLSTTLRRLRLPIARSPALEALNVSVPAPAFVSDAVFVAAVFVPATRRPLILQDSLQLKRTRRPRVRRRARLISD